MDDSQKNKKDDSNLFRTKALGYIATGVMVTKCPAVKQKPLNVAKPKETRKLKLISSKP